MNNLLKGSQRFLKKNSATILTCAGAAGVVGTAVFAAKAATKATRILDAVEVAKGEELTFEEKFKIAAPIYIPSVLLGTATIVSIFGSNFLNKKRQASLIGAYTLLDSSYKNYKNKIMELYGEETVNEVNESIARDSFSEEKAPSNDDKTLFYDMYSDRYFESTMTEVLAAENQLNKMLHTDWGVSINRLYELFGLETREEYDEIGWSTMQMEDMYWQAWIDFDHKIAKIDENMECVIISMPLEPIVDYLEY